MTQWSNFVALKCSVYIVYVSLSALSVCHSIAWMAAAPLHTASCHPKQTPIHIALAIISRSICATHSFLSLSFSPSSSHDASDVLHSRVRCMKNRYSDDSVALFFTRLALSVPAIKTDFTWSSLILFSLCLLSVCHLYYIHIYNHLWMCVCIQIERTIFNALVLKSSSSIGALQTLTNSQAHTHTLHWRMMCEWCVWCLMYDVRFSSW